jgi:hypothetical protein
LASSRSSLPWREDPLKVEQLPTPPLARRVAKSDYQLSKLEEKNCGKKVGPLNRCAFCVASVRSLIIWKTNCAVHDGRKKRPVTRPKE